MQSCPIHRQKKTMRFIYLSVFHLIKSRFQIYSMNFMISTLYQGYRVVSSFPTELTSPTRRSDILLWNERSQGAQLHSTQCLAVSSCVSFCLLLLLWYGNHVLPPRGAKDEVLRPNHHHSQGAAGGEAPPPLERPEPRRSSGVVRFALDANGTE